MKKINYKTIKGKIEPNFEEFDYKGKKIQVLSYLPSAQKYEIIQNSIAQSIREYGVDHFRLNMFFYLYVVKYYTNIEIVFDKEEEKDGKTVVTQVNDPSQVYDDLETNGVFNDVIGHIPQIEWDTLYESFSKQIETISKYSYSINACFDRIVEFTKNFNNEQLVERVADALTDDKKQKKLPKA